jgi:hypothetical protein
MNIIRMKSATNPYEVPTRGYLHPDFDLASENAENSLPHDD